MIQKWLAYIRGALSLGKTPRTRKKPEELPAEILQAARKEASFLKHSHGVDIRSLEEGETPTHPKRADGND